MKLSPASRIGAYEILAPLGAGGMGEVYRARDTKLQRDVALKILPEAFASDPERLARFEREARTLAALNHPHIAQIYGFEQANGVSALVMELVEGEDLAQRLARGSIPLDDALPIARQIAEALEAAHEQGIIHRDLKPANVKVRNDGTVKVLDFGLAKALEQGSGIRDQGSGNNADVTAASPTITTPAMMTMAGMILGTAAYMSPEQAKGKVADKRSDVWAFGCVLYEMLTGRRVFGGDDVTETIAAVVRAQPDWEALPRTPLPIHRLLRRCLQKDPRARLPHIGVARLEIEDALTTDARSVPAPVVPGWRAWLPWALAAALLVGLLATLARERAQPSPDAGVYRSVLAPPAAVVADSIAYLALSPDGHRLAFVASDASNRAMLWVRPLDGFDAQALAGTEGAAAPFWSPDSRSLAFVAGGKLRRIDTAGGVVVTLCDADAEFPGAWSDAGVILFTRNRNGSPLYRVSATGGGPSPVTAIDARSPLIHLFPSFLPDGRHFLFVSQSINGSGRSLEIGSLDSADHRQLMETASIARYAHGNVMFVRGNSLMARPFDTRGLTFAGDATTIAENVRAPLPTLRLGATFAASESGVLIYQSERTGQLVWVDRRGTRSGTLGNPFRTSSGSPMVSLSPDGKQVAMDSNSDIVLLDPRGVATRLIADAASDAYPIWSPDASRIAFMSRRKAHLDLYERLLSGTVGSEKLLLGDDSDKFPTSWSPDGRFLLYWARSPAGSDVWVLPLVGDGKPFPFRQTSFSENNGMFSPDGRWVAYVSDESGQSEVFVAPFDRPGGSRRISSDGGNTPRWRRDGAEIFYAAPDRKLMSAMLTLTDAGVEVGVVKPLFDLPERIATSGVYSWDVTPDGERFLVQLPAEGAASPLTLVVNWPGLLRPTQ